MSERADRAKALFFEGYNCAQSVAGAFADLYGLDMDTVMRLSDGFGGGMGRMRLTCGAVSAMAMIAGLELSSGKPKDPDNRTEVYAKVREMAEAFEKKNGSIICRELLGGSLPNDNSSRPEDRTAEYYKKRPCHECVYDCACIIEEYLLKNRK